MDYSKAKPEDIKVVVGHLRFIVNNTALVPVSVVDALDSIINSCYVKTKAEVAEELVSVLERMECDADKSNLKSSVSAKCCFIIAIEDSQEVFNLLKQYQAAK